MIKKTVVIVSFLFFSLLNTSRSWAAEVQFFDSTNNYLGACQLTNKSEWELKEDTNVTKFEVWYSWEQGETELPVKLFLNGEKFAEFKAIRSACDPYQKQWCNADYVINKLFPIGKYTTEIPNSRQCLKPGGTGAIRLYKEDSSAPTERPSPTITIAEKEQLAKPTPAVVSSSTSCACNQTTIIVSAAVISLIGSTIVSLLLRGR